MLPMDPGRGAMPLDVRVALLTQDKFDLDRYRLTVRGGSDEHDRNMFASACSYVIESHRRGELVLDARLPRLESDIAAFLSGGAEKARRNRSARMLADRVRGSAGLIDRGIAAAYHPHEES